MFFQKLTILRFYKKYEKIKENKGEHFWDLLI